MISEYGLSFQLTPADGTRGPVLGPSGSFGRLGRHGSCGPLGRRPPFGRRGALGPPPADESSLDVKSSLEDVPVTSLVIICFPKFNKAFWPCFRDCTSSLQCLS